MSFSLTSGPLISGAAAAAAAPRKQQPGAVALAAQAVVARGQQLLQHIFGDGSFLLWPLTALGVGLACA